MVKRLISLTKPVDTWLCREAKRLRISVSELVRRLLDAERLKEKPK